ncbi:MAG: PTS sugar transporter subunit IIB [Gemmatimonadota bacterium]
MSILLFRVDERLIHGQVTVGWGARLRPSTYVIVDDRLAGSPWEQELYRMGLSDGAVAHFVSVERARELLSLWMEGKEGCFLLTRDLDSMARLAQGGGLVGCTVNLGGLHHAPGREEVLPYLYLTSQDRERLEELEASGAEVEARDLPASRPVGMEALRES